MGCKAFSNICIGNFRHSIVIETEIRTPDSQGGSTVVWNTFATVFAEIIPLTSNQVFFAQKLKLEVTHKLTMRFITGLTAEMRISFDGRIFHIRKIRDLEERKRFHEVTAFEGKAS